MIEEEKLLLFPVAAFSYKWEIRGGAETRFCFCSSSIDIPPKITQHGNWSGPQAT